MLANDVQERLGLSIIRGPRRENDAANEVLNLRPLGRGHRGLESLDALPQSDRLLGTKTVVRTTIVPPPCHTLIQPVPVW